MEPHRANSFQRSLGVLEPTESATRLAAVCSGLLDSGPVRSLKINLFGNRESFLLYPFYFMQPPSLSSTSMRGIWDPLLIGLSGSRESNKPSRQRQVPNVASIYYIHLYRKQRRLSRMLNFSSPGSHIFVHLEDSFA